MRYYIATQQRVQHATDFTELLSKVCCGKKAYFPLKFRYRHISVLYLRMRGDIIKLFSVYNSMGTPAPDNKQYQLQNLKTSEQNEKK